MKGFSRVLLISLFRVSSLEMPQTLQTEKVRISTTRNNDFLKKEKPIKSYNGRDEWSAEVCSHPSAPNRRYFGNSTRNVGADALGVR